MKFTDTNNNETGKKGQDQTMKKTMAPFFSAMYFMLVMLMFFTAKNFFTDLIAKDTTYEVRLEAEDTLDNGQMVYRMYKNGEYSCDVDYNKYFSLDEEGNTDFRYCALIESSRRFVYTIIFCIILLFVMKIAQSTLEGTPFTKENVNRIRIISLLELLIAVVPGCVEFVMRTIRFCHVHGEFGIEGFYPFFVAFAIALIAHVFNYGVKLQEDSDSIL